LPIIIGMSVVPCQRSAKFYESDCQGRFFSLLIAFRLSPLQSAPSDPKRTSVSASGWAVQSSVSDSSSVLSIDSR
jgi:hypothetical protein